MFFTEAPPLLCIQMARFGNDGRKKKEFIEYKEKVVFPQYNIRKGKVEEIITIIS